MYKNFFYFLVLLLGISSPIYSQTNLLDSVKRNPKIAIEICSQFKEFNSEGISANSNKAINHVSKKWTTQLSPLNAEILSIYIIGLHCPKVF
tara:strand:- start:1655 stop:1930 length:276 start_codon:yes stop_codon:yes gene_type:complete